jgi:hypothetical protein
VIIGDVNLYHELWGGDRVQEIDIEAEELIELMKTPIR